MAVAAIDDSPARAAIETLRALFAKYGVSESRSDRQAGFHFVIEGRAELALYYHDAEAGDTGTQGAATKRNDIGLFKCCTELAQHGYALTLMVSPRTCALYVRCDA